VTTPLLDLYKDLAIAQISPGTPGDSQIDEIEARSTRRRLAIIIWAPASIGALWLGGWSHSWIVGVAAFVVLLTGLWLFAERGDRLAGLIRRSG
jgi:hypothetical protein